MANQEVELFNYLLTQKSIHQEMPFDVIEQQIVAAIEAVNEKNINAQTTNLTFNVDGQVISAQIYVERLNGFVPTQDTKFGTSPTAYNIQVRFPFGLGKHWQQWVTANAARKYNVDYLFDITIINGKPFFTQSRLPLTRLSDYQLDLFQHCVSFTENVERQNQGDRLQSGLTGVVNMDVRLGKTFFTFTLLQYLKNKLFHNPKLFNPSFCLAPTLAVAHVMQKNIYLQGITTGTTAVAINSPMQMPNDEFLQLYTQLTTQAVKDASVVDSYLHNGLHAEILSFCRDHNLHPFKYIHLIYGDSNKELLRLFKDSLDVKRIILMIEGQKTLINRTKMLGLTGLLNLYDQFTTMRESVAKERLFVTDALQQLPSVIIDYDQHVAFPRSMLSNGLIPPYVNICNIEENLLKKIIQARHKGNLWAQREALLRIACLYDIEAAVILSNAGGLANTYTVEQLEQHIERLLPLAAQRFQNFANKRRFTFDEHYTLCLFLNEIFSTVPATIDLQIILSSDQSWKKILAQHTLKTHIDLVTHIHNKIKEKLSSLPTARQVLGKHAHKLLHLWISSDGSTIHAANQLAGIASLGITGRATGDAAQLLLSHVAVFTPDGLASYVEHLAALEGTPKINFLAKQGIYCISKQSPSVIPLPIIRVLSTITTVESHLITASDIAARLAQVLKGIMIADGAHKPEFKFLYETKNPFHQRIDAVTQHYLKRPFIEVLPHRLGISGTINETTQQAFGKTILYDLSIQKMSQQGLLKKLSIEVQNPQLYGIPKLHYARQIVIDYFTPNSIISLRQLITSQCVDLFAVAKGLIFAKNVDEELNQLIVFCFELLLSDTHQQDAKMLQSQLFEDINVARQKRVKLLDDKLHGKSELLPQEVEIVESYNKKHRKQPIVLTGKRISQMPPIKIDRAPELSRQSLREIHWAAFHNNLFAIYLEFILSKSPMATEFSDIIGLQNKLYEKNISLSDGFLVHQNDSPIADLAILIARVDQQSITRDEVLNFLNPRIANQQLKDILLKAMLRDKNKPQDFIKNLSADIRDFPLAKLVAQHRDEFESGATFVMLASENELTDYSHEPVGIIMDLSAIASIEKIDGFIEKLTKQQLLASEVLPFLQALQELVAQTFSYDEKNQTGGRALGTPYGHAKYVEYQTKLNLFIASCTHQQLKEVIAALKVESEFQDIFTDNEATAKHQRGSVTFNREALTLLRADYANFKAFEMHLRQRFVTELAEFTTAACYNYYFETRLPLIWAMKYQPQLVVEFFSKTDPTIFHVITATANIEQASANNHYAIAANCRCCIREYINRGGKTDFFPHSRTSKQQSAATLAVLLHKHQCDHAVYDMLLYCLLCRRADEDLASILAKTLGYDSKAAALTDYAKKVKDLIVDSEHLQNAQTQLKQLYRHVIEIIIAAVDKQKPPEAPEFEEAIARFNQLVSEEKMRQKVKLLY